MCVDAKHGAKAVRHLFLEPGEVVLLKTGMRNTTDYFLHQFVVFSLPVECVVKPCDESVSVRALPLDTQLERPERTDAQPTLQTA